jgi:hypothetical protein
MRGILTEISSRFWSNSWGYGTLKSKEHGEFKVTGTLEGHVRGTCLIVRGEYTEEGKYGAQIKCNSILVDSVSNDVYVIRAWAIQTFKHDDDTEDTKEEQSELVESLADICYKIDEADRWNVLCDEVLLEELGMDPKFAHKVAKSANLYVKGIEAKRDLMKLSFTSREAEKIYAFYGDSAVSDWVRDPYEVTIRDVVGFARADAVVGATPDISVSPTDTQRLIAAMLQALRAASRNGHTALKEPALLKEAAEIAGVYEEAVYRAMSHVVWVGAQTIQRPHLARFGQLVQLPDTAEHEETIAQWIATAAYRTAEGA